MRFKRKSKALFSLLAGAVILYSNYCAREKPYLEYEERKNAGRNSIVNRLNLYPNGRAEAIIEIRNFGREEDYIYIDEEGDGKINEIEYRIRGLSLLKRLEERNFPFAGQKWRRNDEVEFLPPEQYMFGDSLLKDMRAKARGK